MLELCDNEIISYTNCFKGKFSNNLLKRKVDWTKKKSNFLFLFFILYMG